MAKNNISSFRQLFQEYRYILDAQSIGLYYQLLWIDHEKVDGSAIEFDYLIEHTGLSEDKIKLSLKKLNACGFVDPLAKKHGVHVVSPPPSIDQHQRLIIMEKLGEKSIISNEERDNISKYVIPKKSQRAASIESPEDFDFSTPKILNPDTPKGLVDFYYKTLSKVFGDFYKSHNEIVEASTLKRIMESNGDSPELTRKMFQSIIKASKLKNRLEEVSSMKFYGNQRNAAYGLVMKEVAADSRYAKPIIYSSEQEFENCKKMYEYYMVKESMSSEESIAEIVKAFDKDMVDRLLGVIGNEKQVLIH